MNYTLENECAECLHKKVHANAYIQAYRSGARSRRAVTHAAFPVDATAVCEFMLPA
jgi:hypothetical protein